MIDAARLLNSTRDVFRDRITGAARFLLTNAMGNDEV